MKIIVGSSSKVKLDAVHSALKENGIEAEVVGVKAASGVNEQPLNEETLRGARNRAAHARELDGSGDLYIAIENGVYEEGGRFLDKAMVLAVTRGGQELVGYSEAVEFPADMVAIARERGFETTTVGVVMQEKALVKDNADPHLDLSGVSRSVILKNVVSAFFKDMKLGQNPTAPAQPGGQPNP